MPFLLLFLLALTCLQASWPAPPWPAATASWLTWGGTALIVGWAALLVARFSTRMIADPESRPALMRRFNRLRRQHGLVLILFHVTALYGLGWGWFVQGLFGLASPSGPKAGPDFPGGFPGAQLLLLAPFLAGLFATWACFYNLERLSHALVSEPEDPYMSRAAYIALQARHNLLLVVPPLVLLIVHQVLLRSFPSNSLITPIFGAGLMVISFLCLPWLLRLFLGLRRLPDGPLRQRLMEVARRLNFRFSNVLLWDTRGTVANAMVTGFVPFIRYIIVTDRLVQDLTPEEVEAVFGHEVGHIKHHHMLYYLGFLLTSLVLITLVWDSVVKPLIPFAFLDELEVLPVLAMLASYIFIVFGFLSRRCERQADVYGCRTVSTEVFVQTLEKVALLNGIHRERPGWLSAWQHSTIAKRVEFLQRMQADPEVLPQFERRVMLVKWGLALGLSACLVLICLFVGVEQTLQQMFGSPKETTISRGP